MIDQDYVNGDSMRNNGALLAILMAVACHAPCPPEEIDADGDMWVAETRHYRPSGKSDGVIEDAFDGECVLDYIEPGGDCNDADPQINPGLPEICSDGKDNDCDGQTDEADCFERRSESEEEDTGGI